MNQCDTHVHDMPAGKVAMSPAFISTPSPPDSDTAGGHSNGDKGGGVWSSSERGTQAC